MQPQHSFPDIVIFMISGSKRVALAKFPSSLIFYSEENVSRGPKCAHKLNLLLKSLDEEKKSKDYIACKVEMFLWFGNAKYTSACWSSIPIGYDVDHQQKLATFPRFLKYTKSSVSIPEIAVPALFFNVINQILLFNVK